MKRCALVFALIAGCGSDASLDRTLATLERVRGGAQIAGDDAERVARASAEQEIAIGERGLARFSLDSGPELLLDAGARVAVIEESKVRMSAGRAYAEAGEGDQLFLESEAGKLRASDASFSIEVREHAIVAYVVRGELSWQKGQERGIAQAGQELTIDARGARTAPLALWNDWTGGLARPGPGDASGPAGVGVLEARVPDEIGQARWPLVIRRLDVAVRIEGDLAITEVEQVFFNPASETVEGLYRIRVPEEAVLQRFAVDRNGSLVDGYVREQEQARQAYEQQVYRGSTLDPALLEWVAPGRYRARIYPIYPGESRRIVVRYAEWLSPVGESGARLYRYPMSGGRRAPRVQELSITVDLDEAGADRVRAGMGAAIEEGRVRLRRSDFAPRSDFWLELIGGRRPQRAWRAAHEAPPRAPNSRAIANEADERDYWYLPLRIPESFAEEASTEGVDLVIVADASAATDRSHLELGRSVVEAITAQLGERDRVAIVTSDLTIRPLGAQAALGDARPERIDALLDALARVPAGGATDIGEALRGAAALLDPTRPGAVVYVGDGAPTVGELEADGLLERIARLPDPLRLYAVGIGGEANLDLLQALTRGGGLALRVEERSAAADAALRVLAHVTRPIVQRVTVDLGSGIENAYPRRPVDVVIGDVLPISGRVREAPPTQVRVHYTIAGQTRDEVISITTQNIEQPTDLRLRWAGERLRQLLLEGAGREEIAELGTRYGLITPFTSYYVPSATELAQMGAQAQRWMNRPELLAEVEPHTDVGEVLLTIALGPLAISGCASSDEVAPSSQAEGRVAQGAAPTTASTPTPVVPAPEPVAEQQEAEESAIEEAPAGRAMALDDALVDGEPMNAERAPPATAAGPAPPVIAGTPPPPPAASEHWAQAQQPRAPANELALPRARRSAGSTSTRAPRPSPGGGQGGDANDADVPDLTVTEIAAVDGDRGRDFRGGRFEIVVATLPTHARTRCSDAAHLSIGDRSALWGERLEQANHPSGWVDVYRRAIRDCEADSWRDRQTLLGLILAQAGSISSMLDVYRLFDSGSARGYLRSAILRRVRSPDDLRAVRGAFGLGHEPDWTLVEQILARANGPDARVRALRHLAMQYPDSFDLALRLLELLETSGRAPEARRLAERLRADPRSDAGVRTAIGEMYLRMGNEEDARRVFSEIVEFSPLDELARRRLGDLYRAHGWFADAYRQYQTLATIRPDDPSVLLLLAQAAAGVGRIDEALRLEQRLMETAQPGSVNGIARVAQLWSSVRLAKLRAAAREARNEARLEALMHRMRRSGVLSGASDLRVTLAWSHPDAQLGLWTAHPQASLARPTEVSPEHGIEAFDVSEQEDGSYAIEVRRADADSPTTVEAELIVLWHEGKSDEVVRVLPLRFAEGRASYAFTLSGNQLREASQPR